MGNSSTKKKNVHTVEKDPKKCKQMMPMSNEANFDSILLVYGYIRNIEKTLSIIIPLEIYNFCKKYYFFSTKILLLLTTHKSSRSVSSQISQMIMYHNQPSSSLSWEFNADDFRYRLTNVNKHGICLKHNIKIPHDKTNRYDVLFQYNLMHTFNIMDIYKNEGFNVKTYQLPSCDLTEKSKLLFSDKYGLIAIDYYGVAGLIYNLDLNHIDDIDNWKWNKLSETMQSSCASFVLIKNDDDDNEQLLIAGGQKEKEVEILNMETQKWNRLGDLKYCTNDSGIYYDSFSNNVYIGGGVKDYGYVSSSEIANKVQYCNLNKYDNWYTLPETQSKHGKNALIWKNHNLLYIASITANGIECLDLRGNKKQWMTVSTVDGKRKYYLSHMFNIEINAHSLQQYRLLS